MRTFRNKAMRPRYQLEKLSAENLKAEEDTHDSIILGLQTAIKVLEKSISRHKQYVERIHTVMERRWNR